MVATADLSEAEALAGAHLGDPSAGGAPSQLLEHLDPAKGSKHLWLGNTAGKLSRQLLRVLFEQYGSVEDVVTFPGKPFAFVHYRQPEDASKALEALHDK